ncbi:hypothetical protein [Streptacidiphilus fuscans]|uniref:Uncharacterized protein n=1 Tax=Streptacidiphilus fuscans TaxID=2789292 RepID=A0A931FGR2_9ACTN|nr:hypothetical protein [Streptacidiphilus fuscans]MBF9071540.1 hypothetical protein [Streptacidiphilus fuscans]
MESVAEVLHDLIRTSNVAVDASSKLVGSVEAAAAEDDKERENDALEPLRRKPRLQALSAREVQQPIELTPWEVLHTLGRAISLSHRGAGRGLAEHWACLKYTQALTGREEAFMALSTEGKETANYYKAIQSDELGVGFALATARRLLRAQYPGHAVTFVPASSAVRAGFALTSKDAGKGGASVGYRYRPQFFAEVWKPGERSRAIPIAIKGNHSNAAVSHTQLASASVHAEGVHIGAWNQTPALLFSTSLPMDGPLTVHALQAKGTGGWLKNSTQPQTGVNHEALQQNLYPGIQPPWDEEAGPRPDGLPGCHVEASDFEWFQQVLARTAAASLGAFAGHDRTTARYLLQRQGRNRYTRLVHAATDSVQDAEYDFFGRHFVGTDHVFRINHTRVEAFSGIDSDLFTYLASGRLDLYRETIHDEWQDRRRAAWDRGWNGPVSVLDDGTVLALRLLDQSDS